MIDVIDECDKKINQYSLMVVEGMVIDEIGGTRGLHNILIELFKEKSVCPE